MTEATVYLYGQRVGRLAHQSSLGDATTFRLDPEVRDDPERAILGQCFEEDPAREWRTTHRVPEWFSNLLPEGPLRHLLANRVGVNPDRELHLLAALGADLPGAVSVVGEGTLSETPLAPREPVALEEPLHMSLAGFQLKFPANLEERGFTVPVRGLGGRWIAKLPSPALAELPENEAATLSWARSAGLVVPDFQLVTAASIVNLPVAPSGGQALLVKRYDRTETGRSLHQEDFAQVLRVFPGRKYTDFNFETIGRIVLRLAGADDFRAYVERLVFMVLCGNADMHLKNWSLLYQTPRRPRLAPAYDLVATVVFPGLERHIALNLGGSKRFDMGFEAFARLGRKVGHDPVEVERWAREARTRMRDLWPTARLAYPAAHVEAIEAHLGSLRI